MLDILTIHLQADSQIECKNNILTALKLFESQGFLINRGKSETVISWLHLRLRQHENTSYNRKNNFGLLATIAGNFNFH